MSKTWICKNGCQVHFYQKVDCEHNAVNSESKKTVCEHKRKIDFSIYDFYGYPNLDNQDNR